MLGEARRLDIAEVLIVSHPLYRGVLRAYGRRDHRHTAAGRAGELGAPAHAGQDRRVNDAVCETFGVRRYRNVNVLYSVQYLLYCSRRYLGTRVS